MTNELKQIRDSLEASKWRGEPSGSPEKGWVTDSRGQRFTSLGSRHGYGKFLDTHNKQIDYLIAMLDRIIAEKQQTPATLDECFEAAELLQAKAEEMRGNSRGDLKAALEVDAIQSIVDQYFEEVLKNKSYSGRTSRGATWARANDQLNAIRATLDRLIAEHDGKVLVPIEPTAEMMMNEATCQRHAPFDMSCVARSNRMRIWKAMLSAAPQPPTMQGE